jgi:hypothetical protein
MSMKKSNDTIGNQTRDLPACIAVPQPTALPRAPYNKMTNYFKAMSTFAVTEIRGMSANQSPDGITVLQTIGTLLSSSTIKTT